MEGARNRTATALLLKKSTSHEDVDPGDGEIIDWVGDYGADVKRNTPIFILLDYR